MEHGKLIGGHAPGMSTKDSSGDLNRVSQDERDLVDAKSKSKCRRAKVVYSYTPMNDDELELEVNDVIEVLGEVEEGWWMGALNGKKGVFPSNFVEEKEVGNDEQVAPDRSVSNNNEEYSSAPPDDENIKPKPIKGMGFGNIFQDGAIKLKSTNELSPDNKNMRVISPSTDAPKLPPKPAREQAKVLFYYEAQNEDELNLIVGAVITILSKEVEDKGWWKGEVNGKVGVFPDNFVELIPVSESSPSSSSLKPSHPELPISSLPATKTHKSTESVPPRPKSQEYIKPKDEQQPKQHAPPASWKKPQLPSPLKKPHYSPKPSGTTPPSAKKNHSLKTQIAEVTNNNGVQELLTDDMKAKSQDKSTNEFNCIGVNEDKLTHLTANRVKAPNRRPPSQFFLKDSEQENGFDNEPHESQPSWVKELKEKTLKAKRSSQVSQDQESNVQVQTKEPSQVERPPKPSPPSKPAPPQVSRSKHKEEYKKLVAPAPPVDAVSVKPSLPCKKEPEVESKPKIIDKTDSSSEDMSAYVKSVINELKMELKELQVNSVSKSEFMELKEQYSSLKESHENQKTKFNKKLMELMNELDEEKKLRMSMKVEVDRVKRLAMS